MYSRLYRREEKSSYTDLTVAQASTMRAHHARLAAVYAERVEQARAAGDYALIAQSMREYRRATVRCRVLGDVIRGRRADLGERAARESVSRSHPVDL